MARFIYLLQKTDNQKIDNKISDFYFKCTDFMSFCTPLRISLVAADAIWLFVATAAIFESSKYWKYFNFKYYCNIFKRNSTKFAILLHRIVVVDKWITSTNFTLLSLFAYEVI